MTKTLSFFDRLTVFVVGVLLLAAGLLPLALNFDIPYVSEFLKSLDVDSIAAAPDQPWYLAALIISFIVSLVLGAVLVLSNIRSRAFSTGHMAPADPAHGETSVNIQRVAQAACDYMSNSEMIERAEQSVGLVGNRPTVTFTLTADPTYGLDETAAFVEAADEDFTTACRTVDIDTVYKLHFSRVGA